MTEQPKVEKVDVFTEAQDKFKEAQHKFLVGETQKKIADIYGQKQFLVAQVTELTTAIAKLDKELSDVKKNGVEVL